MFETNVLERFAAAGIAERNVAFGAHR